MAAEWCLPLVREGGVVVLWVGETAEPDRVAAVAELAASSSRARRPARAPQDRPHAAGLPAPDRRRSEAPARVTARRALRAPREFRCVGNSGAGRVYAFANQKGGVGKTTTTINVAACLAEAGERVLVVDLDPQANATSGLGMRPNGTSSYDLLDGAPLAELAKPTAFANLFLVPSKPELAGAAIELARRDDGDRYLVDALAGADGFDYVLLDCPPSLGPLTVNALAAADRVVVPVQAEYYALEGLAQLVHSINLVRGRLNPVARDRGRADHDERREDEALGRRRERGAAPLRRARVPDGHSARGARRRSPEPRPAHHALRPALPRRRGLLEGGDGACRTKVILSPAGHAAASAAASRS